MTGGGGDSSHYSGQEVKESSGRESYKQAIAPKGMMPSVTCFLQAAPPTTVLQLFPVQTWSLLVPSQPHSEMCCPDLMGTLSLIKIIVLLDLLSDKQDKKFFHGHLLQRKSDWLCRKGAPLASVIHTRVEEF